MFDDFDTQVQSDEGAEQHEVEQELFQQAAEEDARRQEIREVLEGHLASEGLGVEDYCGGYEDYEPNPYDGTYSEM